ncbi:unnamed protein product [Phyllotreta striolata]|uniref:Caspase-3 n=1 Tax=Phyllotreta striolata TaxID=444603 RepID=A0A9N9XJC3_PHYSR|nr:unnamed protein product [Phyllotreta striolata]
MCISKMFKKKTKTDEIKSDETPLQKTIVVHKIEERKSSAYFHTSSTTTSTSTQSFLKQSSTSKSPLSITNSSPRTIFEIDGTLRSPAPFQPNYQSAFQRNAVPYRSIQSTISTPALPAQSTPNLRYTGTSNNPIVPALSRRNSTPPNNTINTIVPTYEMKARRKGMALIINNVHFDKKTDERKGAEFDEINLKNLLKEMGFEVKSHSNQTVSKMKEKIKNFSKDKSLQNVNVSLVVMMSHGTNKKNGLPMPGNYTEVIGTDGKGLAVDEVLAEFTGENCKGMKGKPKIFIFQCCRGARSEYQVDAMPFGIAKNHADMLVAYSTLPGLYSLRDIKKGSIYIQTICHVFQQHSRNLDVESLLKIVDSELAKKGHVQTSSYENRGFKTCFLFNQNR